MPRLTRLSSLLALLVPACFGEVVEGTGAGGAAASTGGGAAASTGGETTSAAPTTGGTSSGPVVTSGGTRETGGEPTTDSTGHSSGASTGGAAICGDATIDPGELCDDGDADQADGCTTLCRAPRSCLELLMLAPGTADESYDIDPESDGSTIKLYCDMSGGGWTQVYYDGLDAPQGWSAGQVSVCGELGNLLGGAGQFGMGAATEKSIDLQQVPHTQLRLIAELAIIDSWDDEAIVVTLDGDELASKSCNYTDPNSCAQTKDHCGNILWNDGNITLAGERANAANAALVKFSASLSEDANNEAWGLDTLSVFVK
ncbi:fibrinogen-like YCDxxxxGGGW domain-containing protein [Nannocystis sp.]|uniref:fibrinogen-like YCDxxxxGGGW domain-containing protein n=1 Tax=Nannocystis sp. TaxID=1962667 RepID=UPI0025F366BA|nr:fibrinogen-like YCDxxxxGGGW domain-containing protein [Nannocystis sp.]MBK7825463.1 hypothetical protein [Nannocystis sp.]